MVSCVSRRRDAESSAVALFFFCFLTNDTYSYSISLSGCFCKTRVVKEIETFFLFCFFFHDPVLFEMICQELLAFYYSTVVPKAAE